MRVGEVGGLNAVGSHKRCAPEVAVCKARSAYVCAIESGANQVGMREVRPEQPSAPEACTSRVHVDLRGVACDAEQEGGAER